MVMTAPPQISQRVGSAPLERLVRVVPISRQGSERLALTGRLPQVARRPGSWDTQVRTFITWSPGQRARPHRTRTSPKEGTMSPKDEVRDWLDSRRGRRLRVETRPVNS